MMQIFGLLKKYPYICIIILKYIKGMHKECCTIHKNSEELRNKLIEIGWIKSFDIVEEPIQDSILCMANPKEIGDYFRTKSRRSIENIPTFSSEVIDCGENIPLFLAVAALRDDSNEHQWFVWDDDDEGDKWKLYDNDSNWSWWIFECHKATVEELIEHFSKY